MKSFIRFFSSVKLAIVLLMIITLASILGTLIPQHRSPAEYAANYGQLSGLLMRLEVTKLYSSWWYLALLFMFALNTIVCTLTRLLLKIKKVFRPAFDYSEKSLRSLNNTAGFSLDGSMKTLEGRIALSLKRERFRVRSSKGAGRLLLRGTRKSLGHFGSDFVHLGLLVILAGGIISGFAGFRTTLQISEGQVLAVPTADFSLRLDKFTTEYYENGSVSDWKSDLTVIDDGEEALKKTIEVNFPLSYKGYVFYQSSYGWDWNHPSVELVMKKTLPVEAEETILLRIGEKAVFDNGDLEVHALQFVPDFILNDQNEVTTRSLQPNNPAVYIKAFRGGNEVFNGWLFSKFPDFARMHSRDEGDLNFSF
ncbi:MAG: cytochrome c biogenesis protein ResB, partial [Acidobacteria bacterium]|nr:cytochrome c biogenesis protein ResB [Acidobacteriota bacterium]